jgi:2-(1,2-epoxy-1,2-dihydrophenyl)acetyl-CoA isomerase
MNESVVFEKRDGIATIFLNDPQTINALSPNIREGLIEALNQAEKDPTIKVIILAGKGKGFCSGGDLRTMGAGIKSINMKQRMDIGSKLFLTIHQMRQPIIVAVHKYAIGAGFSLALAADILIVENDVKFILGFKNVGLIPDAGAHYFLQKAVGPWKAKELIWTGATISAEEGSRLGFVNRIVPKGEALEKANELAIELANGPFHAFSYSKSILNRPLSLDDVIEMEGFAQSILMETKDHEEGIQAFRERHQPHFNGE